jgi:hypothetical protein
MEKMKNKRFLLGMFSVLLTFGLMFTSCEEDSSGGNDSGGGNDWLVGTWKKDSGEAVGATITLNADKTWGIGSITKEGTEWEVDGAYLDLIGKSYLGVSAILYEIKFEKKDGSKLEITASPNREEWIGDWSKQ